MRVKAYFTGIVRRYTGVKEMEYELPDGARVGDLLLLIGREFAQRLPTNMWDVREERFHPMVKVGRKGAPFAEEDEELEDGEEVFILSRMAGG